MYAWAETTALRPVGFTSGDADTTFDFNGVAEITWTSVDAVAVQSLALQADGKIVVAGHIDPSSSANYEVALARFNTDGSADTTFSGDGMQSSSILSGSDQSYEVRIAHDGKIVVAGSAVGTFTDFAVARYTAGGVLDTTFDSDGYVTSSIGSTDAFYGLWIGADYKITALFLDRAPLYCHGLGRRGGNVRRVVGAVAGLVAGVATGLPTCRGAVSGVSLRVKGLPSRRYMCCISASVKARAPFRPKTLSW